MATEAPKPPAYIEWKCGICGKILLLRPDPPRGTKVGYAATCSCGHMPTFELDLENIQ